MLFSLGCAAEVPPAAAIADQMREPGLGMAAKLERIPVLSTNRPAAAATAQEEVARPAAGQEIILKGMVLNEAHTGDTQKSVFVYAVDGPPEIKAQVAQLLAENYPAKGLDAQAARNLQALWTQRLKYLITGPLAGTLHEQATYGARQVMAVTGAVAEHDGQKWITVSHCEPTSFKYPARMLAPDQPLVTPDQPLVTPDREPLVLKLGGLSLKCLWVPPGSFFMGEPYYQCPHWQEDPPHLVKLTKGFYLAEHPITWEIFHAVMGGSSGADKPAQAPANLSCADMYKFCALLSDQTSRKVRPPTAAEWEYAARVGTSNPTFPEKYKDQDSSATKPMVVKSKTPNPWGFYDMFSAGWESVSDGSATLDRQDTVDPQHIPPDDKGQADPARKHGHFGKGNASYAISELEYIDSQPGPESTYPGPFRFRVVVEARPDSASK